ncbi:MAG: VWA domain-containing protein [Actinomycetota bacterium]|nr:VWA domain-containing protein [Actinomycetota bacterium]
MIVGSGSAVSVPLPGPAGVDIAEVAGRFGYLLHAAGVPVSPGRSGRFAAALHLDPPRTIEEMYWRARVTLVGELAELPVFDRIFAEVFRGFSDSSDANRNPDAPPIDVKSATPDRPSVDPPPRRGGGSGPEPRPSSPGPAADKRQDDPEQEQDAILAAISDRERLRDRPFAVCTPDELEELRRLMALLVLAPARRRGRRTRVSPHGSVLDLRATLRAAQRTGGDPVRQIRRVRRIRPRRVVLLADVSGSMEAYGRAYLYLLHGAVRATGAEAFVFATRLHRLTRALAATQPELALRRAEAAAPDWSGGTRIGEALRRFNDGWARRGLARGAVVVIVSDGWESGSVDLLEREMSRLARLAYRIVWVNPRKQSGKFTPSTAGMAAALPYVDAFVSGHSLGAFDEVLAAIGD